MFAQYILKHNLVCIKNSNCGTVDNDLRFPLRPIWDIDSTMLSKKGPSCR